MNTIVSYILPFYKRAHMFRQTLPLNAPHFKQPQAEVVLVLDEPTDEQEVLKIVAEHPEIKFRIVVNDIDHEWRPPCIPINVGIRRALGKYVAIMSPESVLRPLYDQLLVSYASRNEDIVYSGLLWNISAVPEKLEDLDELEQRIPVSGMGGGFRLVPREVFDYIGGYDESRKYWGDDDTDIAVRYTRYGYKTVICNHIKIFALWHDSPRRVKSEREPINTRVILNQTEWGTAFSRIAHDWSLK